MEDIFQETGVVYRNVSLLSTYVSSSGVSVTLRVDLVEENRTENLLTLTSILSTIDGLIIFSNYTVSENERGLLYINSAGRVQ